MKKSFSRKWMIYGLLLAILIGGSSVSIVYLRNYIVDKKYEFETSAYVWNFDNITLFSSQLEERSDKILFSIVRVFNITPSVGYSLKTNTPFPFFYGNRKSYSLWHNQRKDVWNFHLDSIVPEPRLKPDFTINKNTIQIIISALSQDLAQTQNLLDVTGEYFHTGIDDKLEVGFLVYRIEFVFYDGTYLQLFLQNGQIILDSILFRDYYVSIDGSSGWYIDTSIPEITYRGNLTGFFPQHTNAINDLIKQNSP
ncbi:MAG: hypothetical protein HGN29_13050 [Asgard group archaeon]|nr:hypothetical protein [Asgard group archaeon]